MLPEVLPGKVLFLVVIATAHRVGEFQAVSCSVSFSGEDLSLSYLLEFRAKAESASNALPRSFWVRSLWNFVEDLPDELLLCPVLVLTAYLSRHLTLLSCPRSLFISPHSPSCSLSQNALSFFSRSVISQASSSAPSLRPPSSSSVGSSPLPFARTVFLGLLLWLFLRAMGPCPHFGGRSLAFVVRFYLVLSA